MDRSLFIFDLDGVIYRGETPQPHASETLSLLRSLGKKIFFLTNNASRTRDDFVQKLDRMGIEAHDSEVMTSSYATGLWFGEHGHAGKSVFVVGEQGCRDELAAAGMDVLPKDHDGPADFVVVGIDKGFNYKTLHRAQSCILGGAAYIATNQDPTFPYEGGVMPGGGSIVAAVTTASCTQPVTIGKPETYTIEKILAAAGASADEAELVGDRLDTDIFVGNRAGVHTTMVLGGVNTRQDALEAPDEMKPERIIENLSLLIARGGGG